MKYFNYKFLMVLLALAMAIPAARAQDELTLYDETTENSYVPFYGLYFDEAGLISQVIYPASDLADLIDTEITGIKFYTNSSGINMANSQVEISLGTTEQSVYGDMITTGLSAVATIAITGDGAQVLEIQFENAFTYTGGNLVFQSKTLVSGSWKATYFIGKDTGSQNYTGYCNKASTKKQTFLPKTTFIYTGEKAEYALKVNPAEGLNFGNLTPNVSKTLSLTIKNNGANAVTPTLSSVGSPFSYDYTPTELAPGEAVTIPVTYNPARVGDHTASIVINTTGNLIDDIVVPLSGHCVNEITVYETPDTYDEEVPLYKPNYYLGASQMIYPEADLAGMVNKKIKGFKFYLYNTSAFNGKYNVSNYSVDFSGETPENPENPPVVVTGHDYALLYYISGEHDWTDTSTLFTPDSNGKYTYTFQSKGSQNLSFSLYDKTDKKYLSMEASASIVYSDGQTSDYTLTKQSSRGKRATGGLMEECILIDQTLLNEVIIPTMNVDRRLADGSRIEEEVINKSQIYVTTAGWKNSFAYEKLIQILIQQIIEPAEAVVLGGTWRVPVMEKLLKKSFIEELKLDGTYNDSSFAREYESE